MSKAWKNQGKGLATDDSRSHGLAHLLESNRAWAEAKTHSDPGFFRRLTGQQRPRFFWIGCSDSRVPATEIVDLDPGEMFVHRNVANLAKATDPNFAAALQFAVEVLQVEHVIVVGHYGCGGIEAAMKPRSFDAIGRWLEPVRDLARVARIDDGPNPATADMLCERNVAAQVQALTRHPVIHAAWENGRPLTLHGWIYSIANGLLRTICSHGSRENRLERGYVS